GRDHGALPSVPLAAVDRARPRGRDHGDAGLGRLARRAPRAFSFRRVPDDLRDLGPRLLPRTRGDGWVAEEPARHGSLVPDPRPPLVVPARLDPHAHLLRHDRLRSAPGREALGVFRGTSLDDRSRNRLLDSGVTGASLRGPSSPRRSPVELHETLLRKSRGGRMRTRIVFTLFLASLAARGATCAP